MIASPLSEATTGVAAPVSLTIVGHTNTGKTSLIRTLLRNARFGTVKNAAGTTRHVESATVLVKNRPVMRLIDTPGLEDSTALLELLQSWRSQPPETALGGHERLQKLLRDSGSYPEFEQEIKVIRQALHSDVLLYVVDVREPVLGKYRDEIGILSMVALPIIPVFNFIAANTQHLEHWRQAMAEYNLHTLVEFDTVAFDFEAEKRLYQKLQSVLEPHYVMIQSLIDQRRQHWLALQHAAARQAAELLVKIATFRRSVTKGDHPEAVQAELRGWVRAAEHGCLKKIMEIFEFSAAEMEYHPLAVTDGRWSRDLFDPEMLREYGLDTGAAAAKGALVGAGLDLMLAGLSLGAASAAGALIGATWSTVRRYGSDMLAKAGGRNWHCIDDATVTLVLVRQLQLMRALLHRGHAAQNKIAFDKKLPVDIPAQWPQWLKKMRNHPQWALADAEADDRGRGRFVTALAEWLLAIEV
ncbi:MAG: GTPase/DUF3482 domain-containing protein [Exilibacterium sp.]